MKYCKNFYIDYVIFMNSFLISGNNYVMDR